MATLPPSSGPAPTYPTSSAAAAAGPAFPAPPSAVPSFPPPPNMAQSFQPGPPTPPGPAGPSAGRLPNVPHVPYVPQMEQMPGPAMSSMPLGTSQNSKNGLKDAKSTTEFALREYRALQRRRRTGEIGVEELVRYQAGTLLSDLRVLRRNLSDIAKKAENHRWRRWLFGGALASFIPAIRSIWRRPRDDVQASNDTEYAFERSRSLIRRILDSVRGKSGVFASFAFFVFAVLYVFQNEVSLRVAKAVSRKLKRLSAKVEDGEEDITEQDLEVLRGWRWRILLWSS